MFVLMFIYHIIDSNYWLTLFYIFLKHRRTPLDRVSHVRRGITFSENFEVDSLTKEDEEEEWKSRVGSLKITKKVRKFLSHVCKYCGENIEGEGDRLNHAINHLSYNGEKYKIKCIDCEEVFDDEYGIQDHYFDVHNKYFKCLFCEEGFRRKTELFIHVHECDNSDNS